MQAGLYVFTLIRHPDLTVVSERINLNRIMQDDLDTFWSLRPNLKQVEFQPQGDGSTRVFHVSTNETDIPNPTSLAALIRLPDGRIALIHHAKDGVVGERAGSPRHNA